jgi:hypothetical protein
MSIKKVIAYFCVLREGYYVIITGTCGQDPMLPPFFFYFLLDVAPSFFFLNIDFFSYKQHFATFYVSLYDIYTINTIKQ